MSKPYRPANGTEGAIFIAMFCDTCWYDRNEDCPLLAASFAYKPGDPGYPKEWVMDDDGENERCTQFTEKEPKEYPQDAKAQLPLFGDPR